MERTWGIHIPYRFPVQWGAGHGATHKDAEQCEGPLGSNVQAALQQETQWAQNGVERG